MQPTHNIVKSIGRISESIEEDVDSIVGDTISLDRYEDWIKMHGLHKVDSSCKHVGSQIIFNIVLKHSLYEKYKREGEINTHGSGIYPTIDEAYAETQDRGFEDTFLDEIGRELDLADIQKSVKELRGIIVEINEASAVIGEVYELLVPQEARRVPGQFHTPKWISDVMAKWAIDSGEEVIIDPGVGAASLSIASYREKIRLDDSASLNDVFGIDISPLSALMARVAITIDFGKPYPNEVQGDFLDSEDGYWGSEPDVVLSNPPYTRHHSIPEERKRWLNEQAKKQTGLDISSLSPLYAYFFYQTSEMVGEGTKVSFVTPNEFLETVYGVPLKEHLLQEYNIQAILSFNTDGSLFKGVLTTSTITLLEKDNREVEEKGDVTFIRVDETVDYENIEQYVDGDPLRDSGEAGFIDDRHGNELKTWGYYDQISQSDLKPGDKWSKYLQWTEGSTKRPNFTEPSFRLSEIAEVKRGILTGNNDFFCLSQEDVDEYGIDEKYLAKIIKNANDAPGFTFTDEIWESHRKDGKKVWLLYHLTRLEPHSVRRLVSDDKLAGESLAMFTNGGQSKTNHPNVVDYLQNGLSFSSPVNESYITSKRDQWYVTDRRKPPDIFFTYMSRGGIRFIRNDANARYLSNMHGIYLRHEIKEEKLDALLAYLNSGYIAQLVNQYGRTYSTGLDKIEPNELEKIPFLFSFSVDYPSEVVNENIDRLAGLFDDLVDAGNGGDCTVEEVRSEIDETIGVIVAERKKFTNIGLIS